MLSGNKAETDAEIIAAAGAVLARGTYAVAVSLGKRGCYYADKSGESFFAALKPIDTMANATGAGDAFMAGAGEQHCARDEYAMQRELCACGGHSGNNERKNNK